MVFSFPPEDVDNKSEPLSPPFTSYYHDDASYHTATLLYAIYQQT